MTHTCTRMLTCVHPSHQRLGEWTVRRTEPRPFQSGPGEEAKQGRRKAAGTSKRSETGHLLHPVSHSLQPVPLFISSSIQKLITSSPLRTRCWRSSSNLCLHFSSLSALGSDLVLALKRNSQRNVFGFSSSIQGRWVPKCAHTLIWTTQKVSFNGKNGVICSTIVPSPESLKLPDNSTHSKSTLSATLRLVMGIELSVVWFCFVLSESCCHTQWIHRC